MQVAEIDVLNLILEEIMETISSYDTVSKAIGTAAGVCVARHKALMELVAIAYERLDEPLLVRLFKVFRKSSKAISRERKESYETYRDAVLLLQELASQCVFRQYSRYRSN